MPKKPEPRPYPTPGWITELKNRYNAEVKHAFILHFNVDDLVVPGMDLTRYIPQALARLDPAMIIFYDRAHGLSFPLESMKDAFVAAIGTNGAAANPLMQMAGRAPKEGELPSAPAEVLPLLDKLLKKKHKQPIVVVLNWADAILPNAPFTQLSVEDRTNIIMVSDWGNERQIASYGNMVILTTRNLGDMAQQVVSPSSGYQDLLINLPDEDQRLCYIESIKQQKTEFEWELTPLEIARLTTTLGLRDLKHLFLEASYTGKLTKALLMEVKQRIISAEYGELVEIVEPDSSFEDIGGMDHIKKWMKLNIIQPLLSGDVSDMDMGIIFTGPPGTGKTAMAEAIAGESKMLMFKLNMSKVLGQYVGNSERNMARLLNLIKFAAPCFVWIDEIDQALGRSTGGGDSGVGGRIFQQLLQFMGDPRNIGKVVVMAATNRPDLIDPALLRVGRFDANMPFLVPNNAERKLIFKVMLRKYNVEVTESTLDFAVTMTKGYTGAEIRGLAKKASKIMRQEGLTATEAITGAIQRIRRTTQAIASMEALALQNCNDTDFLPPGYDIPTEDKLEESVAELPNRARPQL